VKRFSAFMKKHFGKTSTPQPAHAGGQSVGNRRRAANWHLIPDELFADIKDIVASEAKSITSAHQQQRQRKVKWDDDATLKYLNGTDADGVAARVLRGMKSNLSGMEQWSGSSTIVTNLPMMKDQRKATEALLKTWAALLCGCKHTPSKAMSDSQKTFILYSFVADMEHLENPTGVPENYHSDAYKQNARNLQRAFFHDAVPKDLYATLTRILPASSCIPISLFHMGRDLGLENDQKCQEAKAADLTTILETPTGLYSYIDGDKARSSAARRAVEWRFTHVEGKKLSSVLDISGCGVDRLPPIARLRDLPAIDGSRSAFGAFRRARLTEVNASGNSFPMKELKTLRNLGLRVHLGNNTPRLSKTVINRLNWFQGRKNKTTFTLEAPKRSQASREPQQEAEAPSREPERGAASLQKTQGKTAGHDFAAPQAGRTSHDDVFTTAPSSLRPLQASRSTQTEGHAHARSPERTTDERPSSSQQNRGATWSGKTREPGSRSPSPPRGRF
jgi:hypothetical protein